MTLNERERYVFHVVTGMVLAILEPRRKINVKAIEKAVLQHRARHLTEEDLEVLRSDIEEEIRSGQTIYEEMIAVFRGEDAEAFK